MREHIELVPQGFRIIGTPMGVPTEQQVIKFIADRARLAYKSEAKGKTNAEQIASDTALVNRLIHDVKHLSVIEHVSITVRMRLDRGLSHELVRHRLAAYTQESTRYCNYSKSKFGGKIQVICPSGIDPGDDDWLDSVEAAAVGYFKMLKKGKTPQDARSLLPTCLKTEVDATFNMRVWRHVFTLRAGLDPGSKPHPDIKLLFRSILVSFNNQWPSIYGDLYKAMSEQIDRENQEWQQLQLSTV